MINKGRVDVYIYIYIYFLLVIWNKKKHSGIKMIDKLANKANPKEYRYHHPKEFNYGYRIRLAHHSMRYRISPPKEI